MTEALQQVLAEAPRYDDRGAGVDNADVLAAARVRPAFFDTSCLVYHLMYAKADVYCRKCGADDDKLAHMVAADVMNDVADACRSFACAPVMAFDSRHSLRKLLYADYKANRGTQKKTPNEERVVSLKVEIVRLLRRVYCPAYNVQAFCVHGYESDDIIASFVLGLTQHDLMQEPAFKKPVVIVSSDHDLHQLVRDMVHWADVGSGILCKDTDLYKHYKIKPSDIVAAKCVGGCTSDNIGNVKGCGDKTVLEVLEKRSSDVKLAKARAALESEEGSQILLRNLKLIRLPYDGDPPMPPLRLSAKAWPKSGVPEDVAALLGGNGIPNEAWPSFADITLPRPVGAVPVCEYKGRKTE